MSNWEPRQYERFVQIRHKSLILYSLPADNYSHIRAELITPTYSGKVTEGAAKRIRKAVDLLLQLSPVTWITNPISHRKETHTLSFITLTIPNQEKKPSAAEGYKLLLSPFLREMRRKEGMRTYIWKAEFQKNGMLHYHITTKSWIHHTRIKQVWNNLMSAQGFLDEYLKSNQQRMPNSTDVHKVYRNEKLANYLQKEISKSQQNVDTVGKIWDCSKNLKEAKYFSHLEPSNMELVSKIKNTKVTDHCTIINYHQPSKLLSEEIQAEYKQYLQTIEV